MRILPLAIVLPLLSACGASSSGKSGSGQQALGAGATTVTAGCTAARDAFAACMTRAGCDMAPPQQHGVPPTEAEQACRETCADRRDAMHAACPHPGRRGGDPACRQRADGECAPTFDALRTCLDAARATCQEEGAVCDETGACAPGPDCQAAMAACDDERAAVVTCMGDCVPPDGGAGGRHGPGGEGGHHGHHGDCDGAPADDGATDDGAGGTGEVAGDPA
jgi:hypothetical protein